MTNELKIQQQAQLEELRATNEKELAETKLANDKEVALFDLFMGRQENDEPESEENADAAIINFDEAMSKISEVIAAPKTVERNEQGFITQINTEV